MESTVETQIVRGVLLESHPDRIVLGVPGTDYRLHLVTARPIGAAAGSHVRGRIEVSARRVDVTRVGGQFIDPVYGRPRIIQGTVIETGLEHSTMVVKAVVPLHVKVRPPQKSADFEVGTMVTFSVDAGAVFAAVEE